MDEPIRIEVVRLSSTIAEVHLRAAGTLRGRLTGPHCATRTTLIESYEVKPDGRVLIPDPVFWTEVAPYLYRGTLTITRESGDCEQFVEFGLKQA